MSEYCSCGQLNNIMQYECASSFYLFHKDGYYVVMEFCPFCGKKLRRKQEESEKVSEKKYMNGATALQELMLGKHDEIIFDDDEWAINHRSMGISEDGQLMSIGYEGEALSKKYFLQEKWYGIKDKKEPKEKEYVSFSEAIKKLMSAEWKKIGLYDERWGGKILIHYDAGFWDNDNCSISLRPILFQDKWYEVKPEVNGRAATQRERKI